MTGEELGEEQEAEQVIPSAAGEGQEAEQATPNAAGEEQEAGCIMSGKSGNRTSERWKRILRKVFSNGVGMVAILAALAILLETLIMPVLQIYGSSMTPALYEGDFVVAVKYVKPKRGDVIAFYSNQKILVKRVIALPGEQVDIDKDGKVYIDGSLLEEPYVNTPAYGGCDISFPFRIPEGELFVLGDHRGGSADSRSSSVGCVPEGQLIGKVLLHIWPVGRIGLVE